MPRNTKPITTWDNQDEAFVDIVAGIRKVISEIHFPDPTEENVADLLTSSSRAQTVPPLFVPSWDGVQPAGEDRHLPVYLLLDTSESMGGAPIEALRQGLEIFQSEISSDPFARDIIRVGMITFGRRARLVTEGLVPSLQLSIPYLEADDPASITRPSYSEIRISKRFDLALQILVESMDRDVVKAVPGGRKGDWRPVVFVLTDGQPTDEHGHKAGYLWPTVKRHIVNRPKGYIEPSVIVAVGVGPNLDDATLKKMSTGTAFRMGTDAASFVSLFQYLDQLVEEN